MHELLLAAKVAEDDRLEPRFNDETLAELGGRSAIKAQENVRPDPTSPGSGRARLFGPRPGYDSRRLVQRSPTKEGRCATRSYPSTSPLGFTWRK